MESSQIKNETIIQRLITRASALRSRIFRRDILAEDICKENVGQTRDVQNLPKRDTSQFFIKTEVKESQLHGKGLFALEGAKKGEPIGILTLGAKTITEDEYQEEQRKGNTIAIMTATRWVGKYFLILESIGPEEYINHSEEPTMLYHCGVCFARKDLRPGEELTVNFRYFLAVNDAEQFCDVESKKLISGLAPKQALLESAKELVELLQETK